MSLPHPDLEIDCMLDDIKLTTKDLMALRKRIAALVDRRCAVAVTAQRNKDEAEWSAVVTESGKLQSELRQSYRRHAEDLINAHSRLFNGRRNEQTPTY